MSRGRCPDSFEEGPAVRSDGELPERASLLGRFLLAQGIRSKASIQDWQRLGRPCAGLLFGHQPGGTIGRYARDLELIARSSELNAWADVVRRLLL